MALLASGLTLMAAAPANADPANCAPYSGGFGAPYYMWEITWGQPTPTSGGAAAFTKDSYGGLTSITWNGASTSITGPAVDAAKWYPAMNSSLNGTHMVYSFADGTEWTADATATVDGCNPVIAWARTPVPATQQVVVRDIDLLGVEQDNPNLPGFNYESWHEGKGVDSSTVMADGLHLGSPGASTTIKGTTVKTDPTSNTVSDAELKELIKGASVVNSSGSVTFQIPVNFGPGLSGFTTLLSDELAPGTHTFNLTDMWRTSRAFGSYQAFDEAPLGTLLAALFSTPISQGAVWLAGFGVQADNLAVVPSLVWDGTEYLFQQPVVDPTCSTTTVGPIATNQDSEGWTFGETRATGHNEFVDGGLHVWTEGATSTDKAAGYKAVDLKLADVGAPSIDQTVGGGGNPAQLPSMQLGVDFDGDHVWDGYLVGEPWVPGYGNNWWASNSIVNHVPAFVGLPTAGGGGSTINGTLDQYLLAYPDANVVSIGYSLGSGVMNDSTIHSITIGCMTYGFTADDSYGTPATVNVNDSQILPIENVVGWGDGYGHSPRSYSTQADGAHIGDGYKTQLFNTLATPMSTTELESLITGASVKVSNGSGTFQVAIRYGDSNTFTTLRSTSLTGADNNFSVTDKWVSTKALVVNGNVTPVTSTNYSAPLADLIAFFNAQGNVTVEGFGFQADSPATIQDLVFNGTKYVFVPTEAEAAQNDIRVTQPEIGLDESNYQIWHQGYANQTGANQTFSVGEDGLILTPGNDPVTPRTQILKGLTTPVAGTDLYELLTAHAGITTGVGGDVTYQVAVTFDQARVGGHGWSTLRSASLSTGAHTFSLSDPWITSKPIGSIPADTLTPLGDILDAMNAYGDAEAIGFGVQTTVPALVTDITWGNDRYYFDGAMVGTAPTITGTPTFGEILTADEGTWVPSNVTFTYQWKANGSDISGETSKTYEPTADKVGATIAVVVTGSADGYTDVSKTSNGVILGAASLTTAVPTISGTATAGETLSASAGSWGPTGVSLAYQWYAGNVAITGATGSTYLLTNDEIGKTITVTVTGTLAGYTTASETSAGFGPTGMSTIVPGTPTISGDAMVFSTLTADAVAAGWAPSSGLTFAYEWYADGEIISGAVSATYTVALADLGKAITVKVTGSATNYISSSATSAATDDVVLAEMDGATPTISGTLLVGSTLTADPHAADWDPADAVLTYQWYTTGNVIIPGATNSTYVLTGAENGKTLSVTVTGTKEGYASGSVSSAYTGVVGLPAIVAGTPTITGDALVGSTLTADAGASGWTPSSGLTFAYEWYAGAALISGASGPTYVLTAAEVGKAITVKVTGSATNYISDSATSAATEDVELPEIVAGTPTITGTAKVGQTLTANEGTWVPSDVTFSYVWKANGTPITGATSKTYVLTAAELNKTIVVEITGTKTDYVSATATSLGTVPVINDHIVVSRIAGEDRYETAAKVAQEWDTASVVFIANGLGFPDALSAGPAAAYLDAPLLLTAPTALSAAAKTELLRLEPSQIFIVGGTGVVSAAVEAELNALAFDPDVTRIGGTDRYETSRLLVDAVFPDGTTDTTYLANGTNFPDALTASPAAAHFGGPVILVPGAASSVDAPTLALMNKLGVDTVKVAGGTGSISAAIVTQLNSAFGSANVTRNGGNDRYATAVAINADEFTSASTVYLATGTGFADALAGAALAGSQGAPLFVSQPTCIPASVMAAINDLGATSVVLLGGTGVLSAAVESLTVCG